MPTILAESASCLVVARSHLAGAMIGPERLRHRFFLI